MTRESVKDYLEAIKEYDRIIEINSEDVVALRKRACLKSNMNDFAGSLIDNHLADDIIQKRNSDPLNLLL